MSSKRIIILASERSGTNLLRVLLGNHKDISAPVAPHFFDAFHPLMNEKVNLNKKEKAILLVKQMLELANHKFNDWNLNLSPEALADTYGVNSLATAFDALYSESALRDGNSTYVSKDNNLFNYIDYLDELDNVKYIYLYRNPLDHAASWLKTPLHLHSTIDIAIKWRREQKKILQIDKKKHHIHALSYESLIEDPEKEMRKVLTFLEMDIDQNCFQTDSNNKESSRHELWKNLSKPIIKTNKEKYKEYLSVKDILITESICKEEIVSLNYNLTTEANWRPKKGYGIILRLNRRYSKYKNRHFLNKDMEVLKSKLQLIKSFKL